MSPVAEGVVQQETEPRASKRAARNTTLARLIDTQGSAFSSLPLAFSRRSRRRRRAHGRRPPRGAAEAHVQVCRARLGCSGIHHLASGTKRDAAPGSCGGERAGSSLRCGFFFFFFCTYNFIRPLAAQNEQAVPFIRGS